MKKRNIRGQYCIKNQARNELTVEGNVEATNGLQEFDLLIGSSGSNDLETFSFGELGNNQSNSSTSGRHWNCNAR